MKMLTTAATIAAVLVSAGAAMSAPVPRTTSTVPPTSAQRGQRASNQNLRVARRHVEVAIDTLQRDAQDYGGHREKAMDDLGLARQYLDQALDFRQSRGRAGGTPIPGTPSTLPGGRPRNPVTTPGTIPIDQPNGSGQVDQPDQNGAGNGMVRGQGASNESLTDVRRHVEAAIDALSRDAYDYGGYKEKAMDRLTAARSELDAALDFVHRNGVQNGGSGQHVSDANLRFVSEHVRTAISRLQSDRNDYGGHRVAAINDLEQANGFINSALAYDNSHPNGTGGVPNVVPGTVNTLPVRNPVTRPVIVPGGSVGSGGQGASNSSLADARQHVEKAIDALTRDAHDYGGYRVKAIDALQAARSELLQALNFRKTG